MRLIVTIAIILVCSVQTFGQAKHENDAKELFWGAGDQYKNTFDIPEKWKNESAVILYKNLNYEYRNFGTSVTYKTSVRKRIKLLDKAAVEEFSEFNYTKRFNSTKGNAFSFRKGSNIVGLKVVKPDGKEIEIDVDKDAVEVDGEKKVAIGNLEVGDIIDYYLYVVEPFRSLSVVDFDPVELTLNEEYPIVDFKLTLDTENDFFINFNTYNGAPKLTELQDNKGKRRQYELVANDLEKSEGKMWFYPLVEVPSFKFQVYFAQTGKIENMAMAFLPEKAKDIKESVSKENVLELYEKRFAPIKNYRLDFKTFLKDKNFSSDTERVMVAYYYMRHYCFTRYIEAFLIESANIMENPYQYYRDTEIFIKDDKDFVRHFISFLDDNKIKYDIIAAKKRYDGTIKDLLIEKNVNVLLKVYTEEPCYLSFFDPHTSVNQYSPLIENTDAYFLNSSKSKIDGIRIDKIPVSTCEQNTSKKELALTIEDNFSEIGISIINNYKGHLKADAQYDKLIFSDYVYEDYEKYGTESFIELLKNKLKTKYQEEFEAIKLKLKEKQKESFEEAAKMEYGFSEIEAYDYKINNTGRYGFDSCFTFTESFKVKDALIKKAGNNYIIEIGKMISSQVDLNEKQRIRTENIYMDYPRTYVNEIRLTIPEGYTISGIDKLNKSVDNTTGSFISSATVLNNTLIINSSKQYKNNFEPNKNWNLMTDFLDAAFQFSNEKILLKKI